MAGRKKKIAAEEDRKGIINKEDIFLMVTSLSNERGIEEEVIFRAIELALASIGEKQYMDTQIEGADSIKLHVSIDRDTGECATARYWEVVATDDDIVDEGWQINLAKAHETDSSLEAGDRIEEEYPTPSFSGRIAAQHARQVIMQKVREAEREKVAKQFSPRIGELLSGVVKRVTRDSIIVEMGRHIEGLLPKTNLIPRENFRLNDRVRVILAEVRTDHRGPQLLLSRTDPRMVIELFKIEVPEIGEEVIEVKSAARDPGARAKVAVKTNDGRIDPVGACVGMRGARVQAVTNELGGERIDIVLWDDNPAKLVINAMAPAEVDSIVVNEDTNTMDIAVAEENLSQAIGRGGQNVRLASELSGWKLNVMTAGQVSEKQNQDTVSSSEILMEKLDIDDDFAEALVGEGFKTLESIAYAPLEEMLAIEGFDEEIAAELQSRAQEVLSEQDKILEEKLGSVSSDDDLLNVSGMTKEIAVILVSADIVTREDLADQSVFDLTDLGIDKELAGKLIMAARSTWFEDEA